MDPQNTIEPRESPQDAPDRELDAMFEWFRRDAEAGERRVLRHIFDRIQAARAARVEREKPTRPGCLRDCERAVGLRGRLEASDERAA